MQTANEKHNHGPEREHTEKSTEKSSEERTEDRDVAAQADTLIADVMALFEAYRQHWRRAGQLFNAEYRLSVKSLWWALVLSVCFAIAVIGLWIAILAALAWTLWQYGMAPWAVLTTLIVAQSLFVIWLWRGIRQLFAQVGFPRTFAQLKPTLDFDDAQPPPAQSESASADHDDGQRRAA